MSNNWNAVNAIIIPNKDNDNASKTRIISNDRLREEVGHGMAIEH